MVRVIRTADLGRGFFSIVSAEELCDGIDFSSEPQPLEMPAKRRNLRKLIEEDEDSGLPPETQCVDIGYDATALNFVW